MATIAILHDIQAASHPKTDAATEQPRSALAVVCNAFAQQLSLQRYQKQPQSTQAARLQHSCRHGSAVSNRMKNGMKE